MSKVILYLYLGSLVMNSCFCWVTDINTKMLSQGMFDYNGISSNDEMDSIDDSPAEKRINLIFPGTKWCGAGNVADNYNDLGEEREADMCCREHDHCPDLIPGGGTKNNLTNEAFYTRLSCACDDKFHECLGAAKTKTARYIGVIYFNTLQTQCFRKDFPVTDCVKRGGWFKTKCVEYSYDTTGEKLYQWFDVQEF